MRLLGNPICQKIVHWIMSSVHENYKLRTCSSHKLLEMSKQKQKNNLMYTTCTELVVFLYWTLNLMNNLLSYCGLVGARIDRDLPVPKDIQ